MKIQNPVRRVAGNIISVALQLLTANIAFGSMHNDKEDRIINASVTVILDKLSLEKKQRRADFAERVKNYINNRKWIQEDYVKPIEVGLQFFLEDNSTYIEDIYECTLIVSGPDIQYYDKRSQFPFKDGEMIQESGEYVAVRGLIDFYMYLIIGNELDKYRASSGDPLHASPQG